MIGEIVQHLWQQTDLENSSRAIREQTLFAANIEYVQSYNVSHSWYTFLKQIFNNYPAKSHRISAEVG